MPNSVPTDMVGGYTTSSATQPNGEMASGESEQTQPQLIFEMLRITNIERKVLKYLFWDY